MRDFGGRLLEEAEGFQFFAAFVAFAAALEGDPRFVLGGEEEFFGEGGGDGFPSGEGGELLDDADLEAGEVCGLHAVVDEGFPSDGEEGLDDFFADGAGVFADFELGVRIHTKGEEVEEVMEVDFPVGFGVGAEGEILASLFAGDACGDAVFVELACGLLEFEFGLGELRSQFGGEEAGASLAVGFGLSAPFLGEGGLGGVDGK